MADGRTHQGVAVLAGAVAGFYSARDLDGAPAIARIVGAILAAKIGGALPDVLEPATHSWHRGTFHSVAALMGSGYLMMDPPVRAREWLAGLEEAAVRLRREWETLSPGHPDRSGIWMREMFYHVVVGAAAGLVVGYVSHLLLDANTPRRLPLL